MLIAVGSVKGSPGATTFALALTAPVFVIEMGSHVGAPDLVPMGWSNCLRTLA